MSNIARVEPKGIQPGSGACRPLHNVFVVENFVDEMAAAAKQDPGRLSPRSPWQKLARESSARSCLRKNRAGDSPSQGKGRGVSLQFVFGQLFAQVRRGRGLQRTGNVRVTAWSCAWIAAPSSIPTPCRRSL